MSVLSGPAFTTETLVAMCGGDGLAGSINALDDGIATNIADIVINATDISSNTSDIAANTSKVTNATHTGEVTGSGALIIADGVIDEANLKLDAGPNDGFSLVADSTKSGGMKWADIAVGDLTISRALVSSSSGKVEVSDITSDEINYLNDTTSNIQSQINSISSVITGAILIYPIATAPTGYLLCDGSAVSRTTYSDLYSIIGTTYGPGNGSTTFNVPNLKGRIPAGIDSSQAEFDSLGETGGSKTHTLITSEIPAHTHSIASNIDTGTAISAGALRGGSGKQSGSAGGDGSHNNLQPYIVLNYVIKI